MSEESKAGPHPAGSPSTGTCLSAAGTHRQSYEASARGEGRLNGIAIKRASEKHQVSLPGARGVREAKPRRYKVRQTLLIHCTITTISEFWPN